MGFVAEFSFQLRDMRGTRAVGGDWQMRPGFSVNLGTGFDVGSNGPGVVLKSRFEWDWGPSNNRP
jgi:hypothetical protein